MWRPCVPAVARLLRREAVGHVVHRMLRRAIIAVAVRMRSVQIRPRRLSGRHMVVVTVVAIAVRIYSVEVWS